MEEMAAGGGGPGGRNEGTILEVIGGIFAECEDRVNDLLWDLHGGEYKRSIGDPTHYR